MHRAKSPTWRFTVATVQFWKRVWLLTNSRIFRCLGWNFWTKRNESTGHNQTGTVRQTACLFDRNNNVSCYKIKADLSGISKEKGERQNSSPIALLHSSPSKIKQPVQLAQFIAKQQQIFQKFQPRHRNILESVNCQQENRNNHTCLQNWTVANPVRWAILLYLQYIR